MGAVLIISVGIIFALMIVIFATRMPGPGYASEEDREDLAQPGVEMRVRIEAMGDRHNS